MNFKKALIKRFRRFSRVSKKASGKKQSLRSFKRPGKKSGNRISFFHIQPLDPVTIPVVSTVSVVPKEPTPDPKAFQNVQDFQSHQDYRDDLKKLRASLDAFLNDQRSEHTKRAYGKDLKRFFQYLIVLQAHQELPLKIDRTLLVRYKNTLLSEKLEHTTIDRHLSTLKSFFKWLVEDGLFEKNPADGVRLLNPQKSSRTQAFSDEEVLKILGLPKLYRRSGLMHRAILHVLFYCGLRRSELCTLKLNSIFQERGVWILKLSGKGNKERIIPLTDPVLQALQEYLKPVRHLSLLNPIPATRAEEPLFIQVRTGVRGLHIQPLDSSSVYFIVKKYADLAGITRKVSPHSCRATAISNARDHHATDRAIQEFAGWSSPSMITRYDKRKTQITDSASRLIDYRKK